MRTLRTAVACIGLLVMSAGQVVAQGSNPREGLWWGLGFSYGWTHVRCDICVANRGAGISLTGRVGGTISQSVLLGAEANGWTTSEEDVDEFLGSFGAALSWYPASNGAFYLKFGFAYVSYRIDDPENRLTSSGFGPQLGAGYEVRFSRSFSIQPYINSIITIPNGELDINGDRQATGVSMSLLQLGLGVTWH